jgi:ubiquitin-conjugating enzyme E2 O
VFQAARWLSGCWQSTRVEGTVARVELADVLVFWVASARLGGTKRLELVQASAPPPQQRARDLAFFCSDNLCFWGIGDRCFLRDTDASTTPPTAAATKPPMSVVTDTRTTVDVLWQDGTRRHGVPSASLVHFDSHARCSSRGSASSAWTPSRMDRRRRQRCLASAL